MKLCYRGLLLFYFLLLYSFPAIAQEDYDFLEEEGQEIDFLEEAAGQQLNDSDPASGSPMGYLLDHAVSYRPGKNQSLINNRSGIRVEYESSIGESLFAKLDVKGYIYWGNDHQALSKGEKVAFDSLIKEAWIQKSFTDITFKFGLQSIVWGEVEGATATDILNPVDNQEFLFVDFEEVRIGQPSISFTIYGDSIHWEGFVTPLPQFDKNPPAGSLYAVTTPLDSLPVIKAENQEPEVGLKAKWMLGSSELSLLFASLTPNQKSYQLEGATLIEVVEPFTMVGLNFNIPEGTTLFKLDIGYKTKQAVNDQSFALWHKDFLDVALGLETTISEHVFTVTIMGSHIYDWNPNLVLEEDSGYYSLSWSKTYLHEDLSLNAGLLGIISRSDHITNLLVKYKLDDHLDVSFGYFDLAIQDPKSIFYAFRDEDRIEVKSSYQF